jgi:hypothetical protein
MTLDLRDRLDAGFADEPPHRLMQDRIAAGRRSLRRRRRRLLASGAAAIVVLAVGVVLVRPSDGGAGGGIDPPTPLPTTPDTPTPVHLLVAPPRYVRADTPPVLYLYGRMFKRDRNVRVLATYGQIDVSSSHPHGAAIVRDDGRTWWVAVAGNEPERLVVQREAPYNYQLFMGWAQLNFPLLSGHLALAATAPGPYAPPVSDADSPAEFSDHLLVAKPGGEVVERIRDPLANAQAVPPCHRDAVRVTYHGAEWFVVGFDCRGLSSLYSERAGVRADSLSSWLAQVKRVQDAFVR